MAEKTSSDPKAEALLSESERAKRQQAQAERALAEAAERRRLADEEAKRPMPKELGGQAGPDPTRYGDWEKKGVISDF